MHYITGPDDPDAYFLACALHLFKGHIVEY